ncbi:DUF2768 domain-containing protein [Bacillus massilinigeriensis]|uniref:DUF2768 domain-containing protein n=1 Tax=Bacillus massilionigeriensis TaxID=1805475 RepID=UPI00096B163F|nr:DUF2768 domain-containing protein [Bacillus massilionigeriensis]
MSESMLKMWISIAGMGFMVLSILLILFSRYKLKGFFKFIVALIAYIFMILSGLIIILIVFSGPTV